MKSLLFIFLFVVFSSVSKGQLKKINKSCQLIVETKDLNIDRNQSKIIVLLDQGGDTIARGDLQKEESLFVIHEAEPVFAHIQLIHQKQMITTSSSFLITNNPIKVIFDSSTVDPKVIGGENGFYYKHRLLLFSLPALIANDPQFKISFLRDSYDPHWPEIRLRLYFEEFQNNAIDMIAAHNSYYYLLWGLFSKRYFFTVKTLEKCYALFTDTLKNTGKGKELKKYIEQSKRLFVGEMAPTFTAFNEKDSKVNSSDIYSNTKLTLLDFWASWCRPCRENMREIQKFYSHIDTSKFQIVSISIDKSKRNWMKAAREENVSWRSYYDPGESDGKISKLFNLDYIPQNRIVDTNGKMIAFDLSPEELKQFLKERNLLIR